MHSMMFSAKHDDEEGTLLMQSKPVLCAECHGSEALGMSGRGSSGKYLSEAIHGFHADRGATCYDCHPGQTTKCNRSIKHTGADGNCITCHGTMAQVASSTSTRVPWVNEPSCSTCHNEATGVGSMYNTLQGINRSWKHYVFIMSWESSRNGSIVKRC